jgi:hypothetical protein
MAEGVMDLWLTKGVMDLWLTKGVMDLWLTKGKMAVIDVADWDKVKCRRWHLHISKHHGKTIYYARARMNGKPIYLHRFIMDARPDQEVDHLDNDGLNCRRENMELVTPVENKKRQNKRMAARAASSVPSQPPQAQ